MPALTPLAAVRDALTDAQLGFDADVASDALESALRTAGWSGPPVDFGDIVASSRLGGDRISAELVGSHLDESGWTFTA